MVESSHGSIRLPQREVVMGEAWEAWESPLNEGPMPSQGWAAGRPARQPPKMGWEAVCLRLSCCIGKFSQRKQSVSE